MDTGAHFVYILQHLLGEVTSVFAMLASSPRHEMEGEDNAIVCLQFANGCSAEITITYAARFPGWNLGFPGGWDTCGASAQRLKISRAICLPGRLRRQFRSRIISLSRSLLRARI
jgi:hypothetical protein